MSTAVKVHAEMGAPSTPEVAAGISNVAVTCNPRFARARALFRRGRSAIPPLWSRGTAAARSRGCCEFDCGFDNHRWQSPAHAHPISRRAPSGLFGASRGPGAASDPSVKEEAFSKMTLPQPAPLVPSSPATQAFEVEEVRHHGH